MLKQNKFGLENFFYSLVFFSSILISQNSFAADSLSYSGRLVKADGAPVAGPVDLTVDLAYTNAPGTILCSQSFNDVVLSNGVFHLKLDLVCPGPPAKTLTEILSAVPATFAAALRVTDVDNSKVYAFQALHAMPFANIAETSKQLVQLGAANGQVLKWNDTTKKWEPGTPGGGGTVTNVTVTSPLAVLNGATTPALSIAQATATVDGYLSSTDWNTFNNKIGVATGGAVTQFYRGDNSWQTLNTDAVPDAGMTNLYFTNARALGVPLGATLDVVSLAGDITSADTILTAFGRTQKQLNALNSSSPNFLIKNTTDSVTGQVTINAVTGSLLLPRTPSDAELTAAANVNYVKTYADTKLPLSGGTLTNDLTLNTQARFKGGANYVELKSNPLLASTISLTLPMTVGANGDVLSSNGAGVLSWVNPSSLPAGSGTVNSSSITDDSIVNADINSAAAIDQSKIAGLVTALAGKQTTALTNGKILVGSVGNLAAPVTMSGDATLDNAGALVLANSGVVANTYKSVTVDVKGRVTGGTNPTTLAGYGITDTLVTSVTATAPITVAGTAAVPLIAMTAATTAVPGYLLAADWTTFNNKQPAITGTSTLNTGSITTNYQGGVVVNPYGIGASQTGEVRFNELVASGTNYVALKAPDVLAANVTYTLPTTQGTAGQVLTTNGTAGTPTLSWSSANAGTVTSVTSANADIGVATTTTTPVLTLNTGTGVGQILKFSVNAQLPALDGSLLTSLSPANFSAVVPLSKGGTAANITPVNGGIVYSNATTMAVSAAGTSGQILTSAGANAPVWTSVLPVANGGTGASTLTSNGVLLGNTTAAVTATAAGATDQILRVPSVLGAPAFGSIDLSKTNAVGTSILSVANGGTGKATLGLNKLLFGNGTTAVSELALPASLTTTSVLLSSITTGAPAWNTSTTGNVLKGSVTGVAFGPLASSDLPAGTLSGSGTAGYIPYYSAATTLANSPMTVSGSNVGIGTAAPNSKLHIVGGDIEVGSNFEGNRAIKLHTYDTNLAMRTWKMATNSTGIGVNNLVFSTDANAPMTMTDMMTLTATGNVGIGTTAPANALSVHAAEKQIRIQDTDDATGVWSIGTVGADNRNLNFMDDNTNIRMTINETGNVGIGIVAPVSPLHNHVASASSNYHFFTNTTTGATVTDGTYVGTSSTGNSYLMNNEAQSLIFGTSAAEKMRIDSAGNVGIGTVAPLRPLHISNASTATIILENPTNAANMKKRYISTESDGDLAFGIFSDAMLSTGHMTIGANGNVGIATAAPSEKLEVVGNIKATAYLYTSDKRLKKNIETIDDSLDKILRLRGVEFDWKKSGAHEIGLIAQEVEEVEPELVETSSVDGMKSVKYGNIVAILIEAMKEEHQQVEENKKLISLMSNGLEKVDHRVRKMEREIASLKDENKKLKDDIQSIKKHLKIK